jgi:hypothetical protein
MLKTHIVFVTIFDTYKVQDIRDFTLLQKVCYKTYRIGIQLHVSKFLYSN